GPPTQTPTPSGTPTPSNTPTPTNTPTASATLPAVTLEPGAWEQGLIILAMQEGLDTHLFAYQPLIEDAGAVLPLTRLTSGSWDDITPALNPNGGYLAFASDRGGQWDIYTLNLASGETTRLTHTPDYDAAPTWSSDGLWLAYETYIDDSLEIVIRPLDGEQDPIQLTSHLAADYAPAWSPLGRQIAFVSTRGGRSQVWLAHLDESGENRFVALSQHFEAAAAHPVWSPDGRYLAWAAVTEDGWHNIYIWDSTQPASPPREHGSGDWPVWSPDGQAMLTILLTPHQTYLTAYPVGRPGVVILPPVALPGSVAGLVWAAATLSGAVAEMGAPTSTPLWQPGLDTAPLGPGGRWNMVTLEDVDAHYPQLHDLADESFQALRERLAADVGWDLLASLENAYIPLTSALAPGLRDDWLYTGRAFTVNTLPINAGWMAVLREDFGQQTYWRMYLRARFQDGSLGLPLHALPWDFDARYSGDPRPYDQGGEVALAVPSGYWVDMTQLAATYSWERLPALSTWRAAYPAARFNEFAKTDGLSWEAAMLEIYPPEALLTQTPIPTRTLTPTATPWWYRSPTPTATNTPLPSITPLPTTTITPLP
ncbi:MAG: hypothetical protein KJ638_02055, partial [Chloroflexi bacterium]|nr:hypothetical protein [Chloroflexota bacterium]